jgi:hypothetical protein
MSLPPQPKPEDTVVGMERTTCCIVGGGPGGAMLALLLARRGVNITLLEMHQDFDREFRGDTIHPSTMEILDQIGLADKLHEIPHTKVSGPTLQFANGPFRPFDLGRLKTRFPYILMVPQSRFLEFLTHEAAQYPHFKLRMHAQAQQLRIQRSTMAVPSHWESSIPLSVRRILRSLPRCKNKSSWKIARKSSARSVRQSWRISASPLAFCFSSRPSGS